jgi:putative tricarboxylic transport membrane protein
MGALVALILGSGYLWEALFMEDVSIGDPLGPRAFPLVLGGSMVALALSLVVRPSQAPSQGFSRSMGSVMALAGLLGVYGFGIEWIGYPAATFLFLLVTSRLLGERSWGVGLGVSAGLSLGVYALFTRILDIPLPLGVIGRLMG